MDIDPNDILSTNVYIKQKPNQPNRTNDANEEFRKHYENEMKIRVKNQIT
jgi:hypothetical protein